MRWSLGVARIRGVPVRLHVTFVLLLAALLAWAVARAGWRAAAWELGFLVLLLACVVAHELAHTLVARVRGLPIRHITLYPFGGMTAFASRPAQETEVAIAVAGPLTNLAFSGLIFLATGGRVASAPLEPTLGGIVAMLFWANLVLGLFNLLPAFPLDGGRILRGLLARRLGLARATHWAGTIGQIAGLALLAWGIARNPWLAIAGVVILLGASAELLRTRGLRRLHRHRVRDAMSSPIETISAEATLAAVADWWRDAPMVDFAVVRDDQLVGFLPAARLWAAMERLPSGRPVAELMSPVGAPLSPDTLLLEALDGRDVDVGTALPVLDQDGRLVGFITPARVERTLSLLRAISEEELDDTDAAHRS